jgi:succinoglycan biosynthesis protein ExoO
MMRRAHRGTVVVLTERHLVPCREGSQRRITELLALLRAADYRVVLVGRRISWHRLPLLPGVRKTLGTRRLVDRFIAVRGEQFVDGSPLGLDTLPYERALRTAIASHRPLAVIAEYLWMAPCLRIVPEGVLRLLDTLDVMHVRAEMYRDQPEGAWVECSRATETELLREADVVMAIQPDEQRVLAEMAPDKRVICVPHAVRVPSLPGHGARRDDVVTFIGSRIQGNVVGLRSFIDVSWPEIRARRPDARLHVYGEVCTRLDRTASGVVLRGYAPDLATAYAEASVVINPVALGTGMKIKTAEALAHGKAVVSTTCGAVGLEGAIPGALVVEDDMRRFGESVANLLEHAADRERLEREAYAFAQARLAPAAAGRELLDVLEQQRRSPSQRNGFPSPEGAESTGELLGRV